MLLNSPFGRAQQSRDILIPVAPNNQLHDLFFAPRKLVN